MRAVLDINVIVSGVLSSRGAPASILRAWTEGVFELVASPMLIAELRRVLAYPRIAQRIAADGAADLVALIERAAVWFDDPDDPPSVRSQDPLDDYLIALAESSRSMIVTGDSDLLELAGTIPVRSPSAFANDLSLL